MKSIRRLPLVRLSLLQPIVEELDRRRVDVDSVLAASGLVREMVSDQNVFVPPIVIHRFLEDSAEAARDPYFCAGIGESLDDSTWPPLVDAASQAKNLGEFLTRFIRAARAEASSARHSLEIGPELAVFREKRTSEQEIVPAQNDAFTAAYTLRLLRRGGGPIWNAHEVLLTVCDPKALPEGYMGVTVIQGDAMGMTVQFPSAWLLQPFDRRGFLASSPSTPKRARPPTQLLDALRHALQPHLGAEDLSVDFAARLLGTSRQSIQRKLRAAGTTLSAEIQELKKRHATAGLVETKRSITDIAASVGFQNPTSFTRAFRSWTGESPREYRKNRQAM